MYGLFLTLLVVWHTTCGGQGHVPRRVVRRFWDDHEMEQFKMTRAMQEKGVRSDYIPARCNVAYMPAESSCSSGA